MENSLRTALVDWLRADPALSGINAIEEESPLSASPPWLGIATSASTDWGTKERLGREVRVALELDSRIDQMDADVPLLSAIESRIRALPKTHATFEIASVRFLRSRSERRTDNRRGVLLEYRFRLLEPSTE